MRKTLLQSKIISGPIEMKNSALIEHNQMFSDIEATKTKLIYITGLACTG